MTPNDLLVFLGRSWSRLLLYPGGLTCLAVLCLFALIRRAAWPWQMPWRWSMLDLSAVVMPWLAIALLPVPGAVELSYSIDIVVTLSLLEWPLVLAIIYELGSGQQGQDQVAVGRLVAVLNGYLALVLATLMLVASAGSFEIPLLARQPGELAPAHAPLLHWLGIVGWLLVLPVLLLLGPFAAGEPERPAVRLGLQLRAIGLVAIAALPWISLIDRWSWLLPLPPLLIALLLWRYSDLTAGQSSQQWSKGYLCLDAISLLALLWDALAALQRRLG